MNESIKHIAADLSKAPPHVRREIEAMADGVHTFEEFQKLSHGTREWLAEQAVGSADVLTDMITARYEQTVMLLAVADEGLLAMGLIMPEDKANKLNLDLYNACAKFCRAYNTKEMAS